MNNHLVEAEELQAWLDKELAPARHEEVTEHVASCRECAALVEDLKQVSAALQQWEVEAAPADLRPPVVVLEEKPRRRWFSLRPVLAFAGTAAVILAIAAISIPNLMRTKMQAPLARNQQTEMDALSRSDNQPGAPPPADSPRARVAPPVKETSPARKNKPKTFGLSTSQKLEKDKAVAEESADVAASISGAPAGAAMRDSAGKRAASGVAGGVIGGVIGGVPEAKTGSGAKTSTRRLARKQTEAELKPAPQPAADAASGFAARKKVDAFQLEQLNEAVARQRSMLAYQANLTVEVENFTEAKREVRKITSEASGYLEESNLGFRRDQKATATYQLRVPPEKLEATLDQLRALGRVTSDRLTSEEMTDQLLDLAARLTNARATEKRLLMVLEKRTSKVREVLEVEREIARTRQEIERLDARRQAALLRVAMASVSVTLTEENNEQIQGITPGSARRLLKALGEGFRSFSGMILALALFFARWGLHLLFWSFVGRLLWRWGLRPLTRTLEANQI